jgi:hypothetical protein
MNIMQDKGPNDLELIIEKLKKENYKLKLEIEMLKKDMALFTRGIPGKIFGEEGLVKKEKQLKHIYDDFLDFLMKKLLQYEDSQMIASTMIAQALRLYKSTLTDKEYREMMNTVVKTSKTIKPFVIKTLH